MHSGRAHAPLAGARERGWALIAILAALALVAFLARDALVAYFGRATTAGGGVTTRAAPSEPGGANSDTTSPAAPSPIDRARALEDTVLRQHEEMRKRAEDATAR